MKRLLLGLVLFAGLLMVACQKQKQSPVDEGTENDASVLINAVATYEYEKEMYLDSIHRVELVISKDVDRELLHELATTFAESESVKQENTKVGDEISAQLIDPSGGVNYKITPLSLETQRVLARDSFGYLWQWDVLPLKPGNLPLRLKAITRINDYDVDIPVFDTQIKVYAREEEDSNLVVYMGVGIFLIGSVVVMLLLRKKRQEVSAAENEKLPQALANELGQLIGAGDTLPAIHKLEQHLEAHQSVRLKDLIVLKSSFQENKRKSNLNVIHADDAGVENARINMALLDLIGELK